ncbi:hypothetical protein [Actinomadura fibrosa]|uniref:Uncharacterized protein n=1 Tax=Actinomadura fibrosa TaxID=111802 RepID=A0ABW2XS86_9ACTN|nr:hypothetical protein [Actinomadura fibrosa]
MRWWGTGLVGLVLLALGGGLPLLDRVLRDGGMPLPPGTVVGVGTERGGVRPVTFAVMAPGWVLRADRSSLNSGAELVWDEVVFDISVIVPLAPLNAPALWQGLGRIVAVDSAARLRAKPVPITTLQGLTGLTGALTGRGRVGMASVFADDALGATVTASGAPARFREAASQIEAMVRTIRIAA